MDYCRGNPAFTAAHVRRAAWWSVMSGCLGHTYGADGVWMMAVPPRLQPTVPVPGSKAPGETWPDPPLNWRDALKLPGAQQMIHLRRFFEPRNFLEYAADQSLLIAADEKVKYRKARCCRQWVLVMDCKETGRTRVLLYNYHRKQDILEYVREFNRQRAEDAEHWRFAVVRPE